MVGELDFEAEGALGQQPDDTASVSNGRLRRIGAAILDAGVILMMDAAVVMLTLRVTALPLAELEALPLLPLATFLVLLDAGYFAAFLLLAGQTVGEMIAGVPIRVAGISP